MKPPQIYQIVIITLCIIFPLIVNAQYRESEHKDITSDRSTLFLGKDVTLDLNGYTLNYADGDYEHIPNFGFEEGLKGWDVSNAPGARIENTEEVHEFIGLDFDIDATAQQHSYSIYWTMTVSLIDKKGKE